MWPKRVIIWKKQNLTSPFDRADVPSNFELEPSNFGYNIFIWFRIEWSTFWMPLSTGSGVIDKNHFSTPSKMRFFEICGPPRRNRGVRPLWKMCISSRRTFWFLKFSIWRKKIFLQYGKGEKNCRVVPSAVVRFCLNKKCSLGLGEAKSQRWAGFLTINFWLVPLPPYIV